MMMMTTKVDAKKAAAGLAAAVVLLAVLLCLLHGGRTKATVATAASPNDSRVQFLKNYGWEVKPKPKESGAVRIPAKSSELFSRYNALQLSQGFNLEAYAGKKVMRYVYEITNYPGADAPVYATLLVYKKEIIGGDVTNTSVGGKIASFQKPAAASKATVPTAPTVSTEDAQG